MPNSRRRGASKRLERVRQCDLGLERIDALRRFLEAEIGRVLMGRIGFLR
jgi:hypothetical protein